MKMSYFFNNKSKGFKKLRMCMTQNTKGLIHNLLP